MKRATEREKKAIMKEQKNVEKLKFGNMSKKLDFLPTNMQLNPFEKLNSLAIGDVYMEGYKQRELCMPDKAINRGGPVWNLQKTCDGSVFQNTVKQETDIYDINYLKYMRTMARGCIKPVPLPKISFKDQTLGMGSMSKT